MRTRQRSRFKDDTLVVGIDVAKNKHVAVAEHDGRLSKPFRFNNDQDGFEALAAWLEKSKAAHGVIQCVVGVEATGVYGRALEQWLLGRDVEVYRVPPLLTHRAKEMLDRSPTKSDPKDAGVISDLVRQGKGDRYELFSEVFEGLRALCALRHRLGVQRGATLNRLHRIIDQVFPELPALFDEIVQPSCRSLLRHAPSPAAVLALGLDGLTALLKSASRGRLPADRAKAVYEAAGRSVGISRAVGALTLEIALLLDELETIEAQIERVEEEQALLLKEVPYAENLLTIPGLNRANLASLLGETGDLRRYRHARQLVKLAGLNLTERSSGERKGKMGVSKRGRARLRRILFMATLGMVSPKGIFAECHQRLRQNKPGMMSVVAGMRRLLRIIFAIARDGAGFIPPPPTSLPAASLPAPALLVMPAA